VNLAFLRIAEEQRIADGELSLTGALGIRLARFARDNSLSSATKIAAAYPTRMRPERVRRLINQARREILRAERPCACGCGRNLMRRRRGQARYYNDACRQRAYRQRGIVR
jgi:hypothetical protein